MYTLYPTWSSICPLDLSEAHSHSRARSGHRLVSRRGHESAGHPLCRVTRTASFLYLSNLNISEVPPWGQSFWRCSAALRDSWHHWSMGKSSSQYRSRTWRWTYLYLCGRTSPNGSNSSFSFVLLGFVCCCSGYSSSDSYSGSSWIEFRGAHTGRGRWSSLWWPWSSWQSSCFRWLFHPSFCWTR